jgi:hypothetical protein
MLLVTQGGYDTPCFQGSRGTELRDRGGRVRLPTGSASDQKRLSVRYTAARARLNMLLATSVWARDLIQMGVFCRLVFEDCTGMEKGKNSRWWRFQPAPCRRPAST